MSRCYECHGSDAFHNPGCSKWKKVAAPREDATDEEPVLGLENFGGVSKPTPQQALHLWNEHHRKQQSVKIKRGALPMSGAYRVNPEEPYVQERLIDAIGLVPVQAYHTVVLTAQPGVLFRATDLFILSDSRHELLVEAIIFANCHQLAGVGSLPVEAFPVAGYAACSACGALTKTERFTKIDFPTLNPSQRCSVHLRNTCSEERYVKVFFEGLYETF